MAPDEDSGRLPEVRVGDVERQAAVDRLNTALAEGRIDLHEFDERSAAAYAARYARDLAPLTADLPAPYPPVPAVPRPPRAAAPRRRPGWAREWRDWAGAAVMLCGIWLVLSVASGRALYFWPVFPLGFWGVALLARLLRPKTERPEGEPHA